LGKRQNVFYQFCHGKWIDIFIKNEYREELVQSWRYCQDHKSLEIYTWCIMPSHVHIIISSKAGKLNGIVRDMKSYTSTKTIKQHGQESRWEWLLWMFERAGLKNGNNAT
jgi:putative transposase